MKRIAIYARVSTTDQSTESQLLDLRRYTRERGWTIFKEYCDNGVSGTKDSRPALNELMNSHCNLSVRLWWLGSVGCSLQPSDPLIHLD